MSRTLSAKGIASRSSKTGSAARMVTASGSGKLRTNDSIASRMVPESPAPVARCQTPTVCGIDLDSALQPPVGSSLSPVPSTGDNPRKASGRESGLPGAGSSNGPMRLFPGRATRGSGSTPLPEPRPFAGSKARRGGWSGGRSAEVPGARHPLAPFRTAEEDRMGDIQRRHVV